LAGVALALAGGTAITSQLYGITPHDPRVFAAVIVTMLMTGLIAAYLPARRIKRIDPSQLLRAE
jgi:ABC-type antimicrobial peptide transport system permease subunit